MAAAAACSLESGDYFVLATVAGFLRATEYKRTMKCLNKTINRFDETRFVVHAEPHGVHTAEFKYMSDIYAFIGLHKVYFYWWNNESFILPPGCRQASAGQLVWSKATVQYREGVKHGPYRVYHQNGVLANETFYDLGVEHGMCRRWSNNGQIVAETPYVRGLAHGLYGAWRGNGQIREEIVFEAGRQITATQWNDAGFVVRFTRHDRVGQGLGFEVEFYETGNIKSVLHFVDGRYHGTQRRWHDNEHIQQIAEYEHGVLRWAKNWSVDGTLQV